MNWKKLTVLSGVALAAVAIPYASAQEPAPVSAAPAAPQISAPSSAGLSGNRPSNHYRGGRGGGEWRNRTGDNVTGSRHGNWRGGDRHRHRWGNHHHHNRHWRHRHHYYRRPYYGFYPYGFGYGYGYPYWGASADLYYNGYHPRVYTAQPASGGSIVAQVQQELANAGYYRGAIDGVIGNGTRNAIRAYERANGLRVDGRIDNQLLGTMGLS
jgi:hypothetical protein